MMGRPAFQELPKSEDAFWASHGPEGVWAETLRITHRVAVSRTPTVYESWHPMHSRPIAGQRVPRLVLSRFLEQNDPTPRKQSIQNHAVFPGEGMRGSR